MTTLVVGATGATGRLLVEELLRRGEDVRVIVRSADRLPGSVRDHDRLSIIRASLLELSAQELAAATAGCHAVASCLGHNLTLRGLFGHPRRLVTEAARGLCAAIRANRPAAPTRFVLMNTTGNRNRDLNEKVSWAEQGVIGMLRLLLPPQVDNEEAAEYLRTEVGQDDPLIEWVAVRPDSLVNRERVSEYEIHRSPIRSVIFRPGSTSRINTAHFMAALMTRDDTWRRWKGQMPVIYDRA